MQAEGLINRTPGKEGKHVVTLWLLSVVQYQLNICISRDISRKKYSLSFFFFNVYGLKLCVFTCFGAEVRMSGKKETEKLERKKQNKIR